LEVSVETASAISLNESSYTFILSVTICVNIYFAGG